MLIKRESHSLCEIRYFTKHIQKLQINSEGKTNLGYDTCEWRNI